MKPKVPHSLTLIAAVTAHSTTWIQSPLPNFLHTLPKRLTIEGQGSGRQGPSPLAPPEEPANDN